MKSVQNVNHSYVSPVTSCFDSDCITNPSLSSVSFSLTGSFKGMCKQIDHFPEDADYEADASEYFLRESFLLYDRISTTHWMISSIHAFSITYFALMAIWFAVLHYSATLQFVEFPFSTYLQCFCKIVVFSFLCF